MIGGELVSECLRRKLTSGALALCKNKHNFKIFQSSRELLLESKHSNIYI